MKQARTATTPRTQPAAAAAAPGAPRPRLADAARGWRERLLDVGRHNNLLFFRDLRRGTLDLTAAPPERLARLLAGERVFLSSLVPAGPERDDAVRRVRHIRRRAREHFEERGLQTLHLGLGMATWINPVGTSVPAAPVLLLPVALRPRSPAEDDFEVLPAGEAAPNETLVQHLESRFRLDVSRDALEEMVDGEIDTAEEVRAALGWMASQARSVPGFTVEERTVLGTFSYAKLPMVRDLEDLETLAAHDLVAALAGVEDARARVRERQAGADPDAGLPDGLAPADEHLVLDADASQQQVVNAVMAGADLVVKGPPGTGKSQTIANLVASLVADGRTVLFVAEKRAAIGAVTRRLAEVGLGDLVFDLHGRQGGRREAARTLESALGSARAAARPDRGRQDRELVEVRQELDAYVRAVHDGRAPWGVSAYDLQAGLLELPPDADLGVRLDRAALRALDARAGAAAEADLEAYVALGGLALADEPGSPWAQASVTTPGEAEAAMALVDRLAREQLPLVRELIGGLLASCGMAPPDGPGGGGRELALLSDVGETLALLRPEIYEWDLATACGRLAPLTSGISRLVAGLGPAFRAERRKLRGAAIDPATDEAELYAALQRAREQAKRWWVLAPGRRPQAPAGVGEVAAARTVLLRALGQLGAILGRDDLADLSWKEAADLLAALQADRHTLARLPELRARGQALRAAGLGPLLDALAARDAGVDEARRALSFAWARSLADLLAVADPELAAFTPERQDRRVERFRAADRDQVAAGPARVRRAHAERVTLARERHADQAALVQNQARRRRGHMPLRRLVQQAPDVLLALKPCWAMSPLLVSQILPADRPYFDVVVFDEASQVTPADAIPSLLRAHRAVVAGDDRQLPPTPFFAAGGPEEDADPGEDWSQDATEGMESILDAAVALVPTRTLTWHYRSADERLIAFSNAHVYDGALTTLPGVGGASPLRLVRVDPPGPDEAESPDAEVRAVVAEVVRHAEERPDETLGVIAFGLPHAERIEEALRRMLAERPDLEAVFAEDRPERVFVKNLERVQGDERDAVIIAVGYGARSPDGRLRHTFGPITQEGGERRLNVAVTRARRRLTVVSTFGAADVDPSRSGGRGVELLARYLRYVETAGADAGEGAAPAPPPGPVARDLGAALEARGIPVDVGHGRSDAPVEVAARHPDRPEHVLAVETDGPDYRAAPTVRERDRLRPEALERLGWAHCRVWSAEWFRAPEAVLDRVQRAYDAAVEEADRRGQAEAESPRRAPAPPPAPPAEAPPPPRPARAGTAPVEPGRASIARYRPEELVALVRWLESDTLPRTRDELMSEAVAALGFSRRGPRIVAALEAAIDAARA